ncbi:MAG: MerR family transcriptional regulator [Desulfobacteraceae bacterium]|nr:MerR family transcriptional regulator [Desulfobacteraceae bacterium]
MDSKPTKSKDCLSIGEMSKLARLPVSTLRYYDEINLLKPDHTDPVTKYRYYRAHQLYDVNFINTWKELHFSLDDIKQIKNHDSHSLGACYEKKEKEVTGKINYYKKIKTYLNAYQSTLAKFNPLVNGGRQDAGGVDAQIIQIPEQQVVFVRSDDKYHYLSYQQAVNALIRIIDANNLEITGLSQLRTIFHDYPGRDYMVHNMVYCIPLNRNPGESHPFTQAINARQAASFYHVGLLDPIIGKLDPLEAWIRKQGFIPAGSLEWIYHVGTAITANPEKHVTEVRVPVKKKRFPVDPQAT